MKVSELLLATHKETPNDAELVSHQLMIRAGLIRKLASGLYSWLPLGVRVLRKVEAIIRLELNAVGCQELLMPSLQPASLWKESGRWDDYGKELLRITDRHNNEFCYGPTHEEVITDIARREIHSYKQLPISLYQIQTKFRDEIRPRFGVMRSREFIMKDAYSFHLSETCLQTTYQKMYDAYHAIFKRLGLEFRSVMADTGSIGGQSSHEFQVLADSGEDEIFYSSQGDYAANKELASHFIEPSPAPAPQAELEKVATPNQKTIAMICEFLKCQVKNTVKTLIVHGEEQPLVALILRGDHELNELKAEKHRLIKAPLTMASDEEMVNACGAAPGSIGPVNLNMPIIADHDAASLNDFIAGANQDDFHYININWQRDANYSDTFDLRNVVEGDKSPDGLGTLKSCRGIEVGHIFQLGDKYSKALKANILNENGKARAMQMGCYGLGVTRVIAASIEQQHDDKGIIWPQNIAPFTLAIIPIKYRKSQRLQTAVQELLQKLDNANIEYIFDDRNERPGVMFYEMDLIGIPHRLVMSDKGLEQGTVEYKNRKTGDVEHWPVEDVMQRISEQLQAGHCCH